MAYVYWPSVVWAKFPLSQVVRLLLSLSISSQLTQFYTVNTKFTNSTIVYSQIILFVKLRVKTLWSRGVARTIILDAVYRFGNQAETKKSEKSIMPVMMTFEATVYHDSPTITMTPVLYRL